MPKGGVRLRAALEWFNRYSGAFSCPAEEDNYNLALKRAHTMRVLDNATEIARREGMGGDLAALAALLHDTGRFEQYVRFRTFRDGASLNHGRLGAQIVEREGVIDALDADERRDVLHAITYHNAYGLPDAPSECAHTLLMLTRDADKLDIWHVMADYFESDASTRSRAVGADLPETPGITRSVAERVENHRVADLSLLQNQNDFRLLQLSWCFEMNFKASYAIIIERGEVARIAATLKHEPEAQRAVNEVMQYLARMTARSTLTPSVPPSLSLS